MMRETSWLAGAWVHVSDGKSEPTWALIGMVSKHRQPVPMGVGFIDPGHCIIVLHDFDPEWLARAASGMTFSYRFEKPGLTLEWTACVDSDCHSGFGEAIQLRIDFAGTPRVIAADERWAGYLSSYSLKVAEVMPM